MTDKEIKTALECCSNRKSVSDCPRCPTFKTFVGCRNILAKNALSLINRKQAEIESLNERERILIYHVAVEREKAIKEFAERLNAQFSDMENQPPSDRKIIRINEVKSLMDWILHDITKQVIAEVVKEMTGETKTDTDFPKDYSCGY